MLLLLYVIGINALGALCAYDAFSSQLGGQCVPDCWHALSDKLLAHKLQARKQPPMHVTETLPGRGIAPATNQHARLHQLQLRFVQTCALRMVCAMQVNASNNAGDTAWHWARNMGPDSVMKVLEQVRVQGQQAPLSSYQFVKFVRASLPHHSTLLCSPLSSSGPGLVGTGPEG
jgi:hypothetical protein